MFRYLSGFLVGVSVAVTVYLVWLCSTGGANKLALVQGFSPVAVLLSASIALFLYRENVKKNRSDQKRQKSQGYLNESKDLLERALKTFISESDSLPKNENITWRTTALLLIKSKALINCITEPDHKIALEGHRRFFALQFHKVLWRNVERMDLEYFLAGGKAHAHTAISKKAIAIIFEFAHSVGSDFEALDTIDAVPIFSSNSVPVDFLGVENYLGQFQAFWERVQKSKAKADDNP